MATSAYSKRSACSKRKSRATTKLALVSAIPIGTIQPSPENEQLYRPVDPSDPEILALADSIRALGVQEPLTVTADHWIVSGHRRLAAATLAGLRAVPCRVLNFRRDEDHDQFMRLLRECNRQRVKSFDEKVREEVVSADPEFAYHSLVEHRRIRSSLNLDTIDIRGAKHRAEITGAKAPFLAAILRKIEERRAFWPLSDRQIHYALLNDPPLIHASKSGSVYRNDSRSYKALTDLLTRARLAGFIPMEVIQDVTRPMLVWDVDSDVQGFIHREVDGFCKNYQRDLMQSQPNHVEIMGEKNTIEPIIRPVAAQFCIPLTIGRGYCSLPPRYDITKRFRKSGKERLVLLMLSDFDPDGKEIAHSFARSLRDDFGIRRIEPIKVALTDKQVKAFDLPPAMKAKKKSSQYKRFAYEHGDRVWELEALPPETLQKVLKDAIDAVIDAKAFNHEIDQEKADAAQLEGMRRVVLGTLKEGGWEE